MGRPLTDPVPSIPDFTVKGVDGITALSFEPAAWPGNGGSGTILRVIHLTSGVGRLVTIGNIDMVADWFANGSRELSIYDTRRTADLEWSGGYVQVHVWQNADGRPQFRGGRFNHAFMTTLDPKAVRQVADFLDQIRRSGWAAYAGGTGGN